MQEAYAVVKRLPWPAPPRVRVYKCIGCGQWRPWCDGGYPNDPVLRSQWYHGPHGWVMRDRILLPEPVPCCGAQGLWNVPPTVLDQIRDQLAHLDKCIEEPL